MSAKHMSDDSSPFETLEAGEDPKLVPVTRARKRRKMSFARVLSALLIIAGVLLLLVAGGLYGVKQYRYAEQERINRELAKHVTIREISSDVAQDKEECPIEVDWASLKAVNQDVVGWIYVPGTVVNYPVYQGETNDTYIRTNALGEWSVGGQVFLDAENTAPGMVDHQSILFGHHLQDGTMFQPLSLLDDQTVFDATETIWYLTEKETYCLEPLFMYYVFPEDITMRKFKFGSIVEFRNYLREKLDLAVTRRADADTLIENANRVLTMSTCNYYEGYGRSILVAIEKQ